MRSVKYRCVWGFILSWSLTLVLWLSAFDFVQVDGRAQGTVPDPSEDVALRAVVKNYFAAYSKKDLVNVVALWSDQSPNLAAHKESLRQQFTSEDLSFGPPVLSQIKVENEKTSLLVTIAPSLEGDNYAPPR